MISATPAATSASSADDPLGWTPEEWRTRFASLGIKSAHADTAWAAVHRGLVVDWRASPALPESVRRALAEVDWAVRPLAVVREQASVDGFTRKFLLRLHDGETVETVLMRYRGRVTACISTQAGCAMGCVFCATGQSGFRRQLHAAEIVAQAMHVARILAAAGERLRNIVLMGQGEPLHNYDAVAHALDLLTHERGMALAHDRITLSTVGLVSGIRRLADEGRRCSLAVSLHGATDAERNALVPIGRRWNLAELMDACRHYTATTGRKIFFEWTLIEGHNDGPETAAALGKLLVDQHAHVNLIPLNPTEGFTGRAASLDRAKRFQEILREHGIPSTIRQRRGIDIAAGCGQLAGASAAD
ncbi:23S rRNA (adenine(2503)-C(2))-methyltransferase RlmN [Opitutales bacterium ASA1]|uniref:23S rRNA (adenine(2503)-C(2))-methyltransferase RlmN n=1 Tax=Congregicoccus parvus TaxID=3081749 RepID=UPI002B29739E|nr:23S rRNA (adenine(2503)-C(2))-methyltransferase RlmN [Opitutales bacterium ASA1]